MKSEYFVTKSGKPCTLLNNGLHRKGVLVTCEQDEKEMIFGLGYGAGFRRAESAISRTLNIVHKLDGSILTEWEKIKKVMQPGAFKIEKRKCLPSPTT